MSPRYMQKLLTVFKTSLANFIGKTSWANSIGKPKIYKSLITALLVFIPLYPKFPALRLMGVYVSIRLEDFLILFTLLFFLYSIIKNFKPIFEQKLARAIILFLFIGLASTISAIFLTQTVSSGIVLLHWFRRIEYLSLFFIGFTYIKYINKDKNIFEYFIKVLLLVNLFILLYGLGQKYLSLPVITTQNEEYSKGIALRWVPGSHINSTFAGHYDLASYLVLTIPIFVTSFFVLKGKVIKILLTLSIASGFWLFSSAVSRISIAAFLAAVTVSLFLFKKYKEILIFVIIAAVAFGFSPDLRARYGRIIEVVKEKISSVVTVYAQEAEVFEDRSTSIRLNVEWPRALRAFVKNPALGTGYSSITLATDNDYLRALGETGLLGLLAFILIFINIYKKLKTIKFNNDFNSIFKASFIGSTIAILLTAVFIDIFEASKFATMFWLFTGLTVGSIDKTYE